MRSEIWTIKFLTAINSPSNLQDSSHQIFASLKKGAGQTLAKRRDL